MPKTWILPALAVAAVTVAVAVAAVDEATPPAPPADLVLLDAAVYTADAARSWARGLAVRDGKIVAVGSTAEVEAFVGPATRVERLPGRMVVPGFVDAHVHLLDGGLRHAECWLGEASTAAEVLAEVAGCAAGLPADAWVRGNGWDLTLFPEEGPDRRDLDPAVGGRPAYLLAVDGHSAWASSRALAIAGIDAATPDPETGRIERRPDGTPTGTLREEAKGLVARHVPPWSDAEMREALRRGLAAASAAGVTTALDARVDARTLDAYRALAAEGPLPVDVRLALLADPRMSAREETARLVALRDEARGAGLDAGAVKVFVDGVIESRTASLVDPYLGGEPDDRGRPGRGRLEAPAAAIAKLVILLDAAGFDVHFHAIGDGAVRVALDAVAAAAARNGPRDRRPHLAHLQLVHPDDVARFRELGAVAVFQPLWAIRDAWITDLTEPKVGPERSGRLYPLGTLVRSGAVVAGGSDWPVTTVAPLPAIEVAVTRRHHAAAEGAPWLPTETLDLADALALYTTGAAWALRREDRAGSLSVGHDADLVVLARDLFAHPPTAIGDTPILAGWSDGREVFRAEEALGGARLTIRRLPRPAAG